MNNISAALKAHYAGDTTLARLWTVTLLNSTVYRFTDHDTNIIYLGNTYYATGAFNSSDVQSSAGFAVDNMESTGYLANDAAKDAIMSGLWDFAKVRIVEVNWRDLTMGERYVQSGRLGQASLTKHGFRMELRGLTQLLQTNIGELTSLSCRYEVGDTRCTKSLTDYTVTTATVLAVTSNHQFTSDLPTKTVRLTPSTTGAPPNDYFQAGKFTWLTGLNAGLPATECDLYDTYTGMVTLARDAYYTVQVGDTFSAIAGCNKLHKTGVGAYLGDCKIKFGNVINFGGEPELVGEKIRQIGH